MVSALDRLDCKPLWEPHHINRTHVGGEDFSRQSAAHGVTAAEDKQRLTAASAQVGQFAFKLRPLIAMFRELRSPPRKLRENFAHSFHSLASKRYHRANANVPS